MEHSRTAFYFAYIWLYFTTAKTLMKGQSQITAAGSQERLRGRPSQLLTDGAVEVSQLFFAEQLLPASNLPYKTHAHASEKHTHTHTHTHARTDTHIYNNMDRQTK